MKTQIILRLVLTALFLFATLQNKGIRPSNNLHHISKVIEVTTQTQAKEEAANICILYAMCMKETGEPVIDDEEHEFLRFHFERIKNSRRCKLIKIVAAKSFLIIMHLLMIISPFPNLFHF